MSSAFLVREAVRQIEGVQLGLQDGQWHSVPPQQEGHQEGHRAGAPRVWVNGLRGQGIANQTAEDCLALPFGSESCR